LTQKKGRRKVKLNKKELFVKMAGEDFFNQSRLAEAMQVSRATISLWMHGGGISENKLTDLCRVFACARNEILDQEWLDDWLYTPESRLPPGLKVDEAEAMLAEMAGEVTS